jgi:hypothetical protein
MTATAPAHPVVQIMRALAVLMRRDHGLEISLEDPYAIEALLDAAREAQDREAERLAYALCDALDAERRRERREREYRERLRPGYRPPVHEHFVGPNPTRVYRGVRVDAPPPGRPRVLAKAG